MSDKIIEELKDMTYCECYECCSRHIMFYSSYGDEYTCEECYRTLSFSEMNREEDSFEIEWKRVKKYMRNHMNDIKEVMRIFVVEIMNEDEDLCEDLCYELIEYDTLMGN